MIILIALQCKYHRKVYKCINVIAYYTHVIVIQASNVT